ncbi:MAG: hypothetical protein IJA72_02620 [Clostridia bacterium]|nr:hypothetical protein [Clostridia bacterium]
MEKITLYEAVVEFQHKFIWHNDEPQNTFWQIGLFENEQDANHAIQIYEKAHSIKKSKCTGNHYVASYEYPKHLNVKHYKNLDEFINQNVPVMEYIAFIGQDGLNKLLKEIGFEPQEEKNLRIIERMIKEYNDKLHFALRTSSTSEESIENIKESIKYLETLRDKTTGFTK